MPWKINKLSSLCIYLLIPFVLLSGCENQPEIRSSHLTFDNSVSLVKNKGKFSISLPKNHPDKLAIATPDGNWFYIQGNGIKKQLMSKEAFIKAVALSIDPNTLKGTHWVDGKATTSAVFTKTGIYSIYLSDNLETEIDNSLTYIKKIRFIN